MGAKVSRTDFEWTYTEEPHASRRKEILGEFFVLLNRTLIIRELYHFSPVLLPVAKYPEIKKLYGIDTNFKWVVLGLVTFQILSLFVVQHFQWPLLILSAYCVGGVINHTLMLGELLFHNLISRNALFISEVCMCVFLNVDSCS